MLRLASVAFGSFIASPATLLEAAAWPAGVDEDADGDSPGLAAESLAGCVEQPKANAASTANGMTRTAGFMVDPPLEVMLQIIFIQRYLRKQAVLFPQ